MSCIDARARTKRLFMQLRTPSLDALLLTRQPDIFYFTGFDGEDSWVVLRPSGKAWLLTDSRYELWARKRIFPFVSLYIRKGSMIELLLRLLLRAKITSLGFIEQHLSVMELKQLRKKIKMAKLIGINSSFILSLRAVKAPCEVNCIRKAVRIAEKSFYEFLDRLTPDMTERKAAAELEYILKSNGSEDLPFRPIIASGRNSAKPHAKPEVKRIGKNVPVIIDFGATFGGYCCDLTRTIWLGKMSRKFEYIYKVSLEAQIKAIEAVREGVSCGKVDRIVRQVIKKAGLGNYIAHSAGHGFGLEVHEEPILSEKLVDSAKLLCGHTITIEPGIYIPEIGGVRVEDDLLVRKGSGQLLSSLPKAANEVVI